jgi:predicted anti-sigma-YlaC factor YlaD
MRNETPGIRAAVAVMLAISCSGCSIQKLVVTKVGGSLASGESYASDDDPEFVGQALPFGLKTIEGLLAQYPEDRTLLLAACSGFTQYAYVYLQCEADYVEDTDLARARVLRDRALRMYRRALAYGWRGLDSIQPGLVERIRRDPAKALAVAGKEDVPLLYWTGLAWGAAISAALTDSDLTTDLSLAEALMRRARELDEGFALGSILDFYISYHGGRAAAAGGSVDAARKSLELALTYAAGRRAAPLVTFAEVVDVATQDRQDFDKHLEQALAVDPDASPDQRLANIVAQKRARWLLAHKDLLFLE